ncbi:biotin-protein ligase [Sporodiniella umbellata]|nr:biotin-protein ligase [Sporodiniella umbellata]
MLVLPGGRDIPFCEQLNGAPNARIRRYVEQGGNYLGLCAGSYYASDNIEFEKEHPWMAIVETRELAFYPGLCRGTTYPGFVYNSESGARSVPVIVEADTLGDLANQEIKMYYNGGGYFVHPEKYSNVQVLCRFKEHGLRCTDEPKGPAAIVLCQVGDGKALLIATHPEYDAHSESLLLADRNTQSILSDLVYSEAKRKQFFRLTFSHMGLRVPPLETRMPEKSTPIYLSGLTPAYLHSLLNTFPSLLIDELNPFAIHELDTPLDEHSRLISLCRLQQGESPLIELIYPSPSTLEPLCVPSSITPLFHPQAYYQHLSQHRKAPGLFGNTLLYAEVLTSTQTLLEKNPKFLKRLPTGTLCVASHQIAGKGRGGNGWISQLGALQFSFVLRHSVRAAPMVFIQYMIALAMVESIRSKPGYRSVPLRLKWPNDIYIEGPQGELKKVGGVLVNSCFFADEWVIIIGCGLNLSNSLPTVSINDILQQLRLPSITSEQLLADIVVLFENYYLKFLAEGIDTWFLDAYYERWLHSQSIVTLESYNNERARILGITPDYGMLKVESLDRPGKFYGLLPDGNRFDMMKGLIVQKK